MAAALAGCGGSGGSSTITIGATNNKSDGVLLKAGYFPAAKRPTTGPLSIEPKVTPPEASPPTKLVKKDLILGTGEEARTGDSITVDYVGVLYKSGKFFDSSWERNEQFQLKLGYKQYDRGWDQGVPGMRVGGRRELIVPSKLGFGESGAPPAVPPNAPLMFVVDLLGVNGSS